MLISNDGGDEAAEDAANDKVAEADEAVNEGDKEP